jgi:drug/metabolite transporter (DMT)-like permease
MAKQVTVETSRQVKEMRGLAIGGVGILIFSLTLPASHLAVASFGSLLVGPGRALISAVFAGFLLAFKHERWPGRHHLPRLAIIAGGAIFGFPLLTAWAMDRVPASHGAIELALLPLTTATVAALRHGERPSGGFWLSSAAAAASVVFYVIIEGLGSIHWPDVALLAAVVVVAFAYAEGGQLAQDLGGWQVIAWAIVLSAPVVLVLDATVVISHPDLVINASWKAWAALLYLGTGSQFFGFVAWYSGMSMGGVARVSQAQYLQPFLTLIWSWILLGERLTWVTILAAVVVVAWVAIGKQSPIRHNDRRAARKQIEPIIPPKQ